MATAGRIHMEEAQTIPLAMIFLACLFTLPILAAGTLVILRRSSRLRHLVPAIMLSAVTASLLVACFGLSQSTMPIRPYETSAGFPWLSLVQVVAAGLYVGFGIGAALASVLAIPVALILQRLMSRSSEPEGAPPRERLGPP
jgi:hypothetical protein